MERTKTDIIRATTLQADKIAHHVNYIGGVKDFLNSIFIDSSHSSERIVRKCKVTN